MSQNDHTSNKKSITAGWSTAGLVIGFLVGFLLLDSIVLGVAIGIGLAIALGASTKRK